MLGLKMVDRLIHHIKVVDAQDTVERWMRKHGVTKAEMFLMEERDEELEEINEDLENLFNKVNDKSKGAFYEGFDWYVERDKDGKLHLHVVEI